MTEVTYSVQAKHGRLWQIEGEFDNEKEARKCLNDLVNLFRTHSVAEVEAVRLVKTVTTYTIIAHVDDVETE